MVNVLYSSCAMWPTLVDSVCLIVGYYVMYISMCEQVQLFIWLYEINTGVGTSIKLSTNVLLASPCVGTTSYLPAT